MGHQLQACGMPLPHPLTISTAGKVTPCTVTIMPWVNIIWIYMDIYTCYIRIRRQADMDSRGGNLTGSFPFSVLRTTRLP